MTYTTNKDGSITLRIYKSNGVRVPLSKWKVNIFHSYLGYPIVSLPIGYPLVTDIYTNKEERVFCFKRILTSPWTEINLVPSHDCLDGVKRPMLTNIYGKRVCTFCESYIPKKSLYQRLKELISKRKDKYNGK